MRYRCRRCGIEFEVRGLDVRCPKCGERSDLEPIYTFKRKR